MSYLVEVPIDNRSDVMRNGEIFNKNHTDDYEEFTTSEKWILTTILSLVILFTASGNLLTVVCVIRDKSLHSVTYAYIASLACADLIVASVVMPFSTLYIITFDGVWVFGSALCDLWQFMDYVGCTASLTNLCAIALDRYQTVSKPLKSIRTRTRGRVAVTLTITWLIPLVHWIVIFSVLRSLNGFPPPHKCSLEWRPNFSVLIASTIIIYIPIIITLTLFVMIFVSLRMHAVRLTKRLCRRSFQYDPSDSQTTTVSFLEARQSTGSEASTESSAPVEDDGEVRGCCGLYAPRNVAGEDGSEDRGCCGLYAPRNVAGEDGSEDRGCCGLYAPRNVAGEDGSEDRGCCGINFQRVKQETGLDVISHENEMDSDDVFMFIFCDSRWEYISYRTVATNTSPQLKHKTSYKDAATNTSPNLYWKSLFTSAPLTKTQSEPNLSSDILREPEIPRRKVKCLDSAFSTWQIDRIKNSPKIVHEAKWLQIESKVSGVRKSPYQTTRTRKRHSETVEKIRLAQQIRAARNLAVLMAFLVLCWLPFSIMWPIHTYCPSCLTPKIYNLTFWINYLNSSMNPIIYCLCNPNIRSAFKRFLRRH